MRRTLKVRRLRREYRTFSTRITAHIHQLKDNASPERAERALSDWKSYLEKLEAQPISKLTTKEILELDYTSELREALRSIDRSVYGHIDEQDLYKRFQSIEDFTEHRFSTKLESLRHDG